MTDKELLMRISRYAGQRAGYKQLVRELGLRGGKERRLLLEQLDRLTSSGRLAKINRESWAIASVARRRNPWISGHLDLHRDGYGFVQPESDEVENGDIFIPPDAIESAMHGDMVLVELLPHRGDGHRAGRILRVLERRNSTVVGIFHYAGPQRLRERGGSGNYVTPLNARINDAILIPFGAEVPQVRESTDRVMGAEAPKFQADDLEGLVVDVAITDWPTSVRPARGRVIEVLGDRDAFGVDVEILIRKHYLPHIFPDRALQEARLVAVPPVNDPEIQALSGSSRRDFRGLPIVTIDGETAKDFDDAVMVRALENGGYELQVHIADVAHYVRPETALDTEARLRGNSVYFPDRAIPMLPMELSTDVCSLRPGEDRLVLSCVMRLDSKGAILSSEVMEGVIRSVRRMTYTQVHKILDGDAATREEFAALVPEFEPMYALARLLQSQREQRGSIDFDLPEPVIEFDDAGHMRSIVRSERTWANRLIEEFMLAANESVAAWIESFHVPSLYRIHEKPDTRRVADFEEMAAQFGYSLGIGALPIKRVELRGDRRARLRRGSREKHVQEIPEDIEITPQMYQKLAKRLAGKPEERILTYLMLRSLKQARYSEKNEGHFALATSSYTHFTSPIRRYADLTVHRIAKFLLSAGVPGDREISSSASQRSSTHSNARRSGGKRRHERSELVPPFSEQELAAIAQEVSQCERRADDAEHELIEWKKIRFMQDKIGEEFSGMVLNVTKFGLFVELDDLFIEGLVPLATLQEDRYRFNENSRQLLARSGKRISVGDPVRVILDRIDVAENKLQFALIETSLIQEGQVGKRVSEEGRNGQVRSGRRPGERALPPSARDKRKKAGKRSKKK